MTQHSNYRRDLWTRLVRTLRALYLITFGTKAEAIAAGEGVQGVHAHVAGVTDRPLGVFPAGTRYSAEDPELQLWVHATLVSSSLAVYGRFVEELSAEEEEHYYREMALVARLFGVPAAVIPRSLGDFGEYFDAQISSRTIAVTEPARNVAAVILGADIPAPMRVLVPAHRLSTAGLLPPRLREGYGLRWTPLHELALPVAARSVRVAAAPVLAVAGRVAPPVDALAA